MALWLALDAEQADLLDDAQRFVVSRLLPSQISGADAGPDRPITAREMGAYGGVHALPHGGKQSTIDVTAAVLHTLTDIYRHIAVAEAGGLRINFALAFEDERVTITVQRGDEAIVTVTVKVRSNVLVRIPGWAPPESVRVTAGDKPVLSRAGNYALIPESETPGMIRLCYALPVRRTVERTSTGQEYHFSWRGDEIVGVSPNDAERPFYSPA